MTKETLDLNLSANYVTKWEAWEVGREVVCNAMDTGLPYSYECPEEDICIVTTESWPSIGEMKVIGASTKDADSIHIGQFGEGLKLAALACTRAGGNMCITCPEYTARFKFELKHGHKVLQAEVSEGAGEKCIVFINLEGIKEALEGKFIREPIGRLEKIEPDTLKVFYKGVYVFDHGANSIYDWNLENIEINRDRDLADIGQVQRDVSTWLMDNMTKDIAEKLMRNEHCFESDSLSRGSTYGKIEAKEMLLAAFNKVFGAKSVLSSPYDRVANTRAVHKGYNVVDLNLSLKSMVQLSVDLSDGILTTEQLAQEGEFQEIVTEKPEWKEKVKDLNMLTHLLECPVNLRFFQHYEGAPIGEAKYPNGTKVIMLNESLFDEGQDNLRVGTFLHELAHIRSESGDGCLMFEEELSNLLGEVAIHLLTKLKWDDLTREENNTER